jgi:hypothetical protein
MQIQRILGWLFLVVTFLVGFAQTYGLLTVDPPPTLREFFHSYAIRSSIECYGFGVAAAIVGLMLLRNRARSWSWVALALAIVGFWLFVGREVWVHYVVLPSMRQNFLATHRYFGNGPVWISVPRLAWHFLLPAAVVLSALLTVRRYKLDERT